MTSMIPYRNGRIPALLGWEPFRLFDDMFRGDTLWNTMPVQTHADDDHVYVTADLPGVDAKDVDLTYERGTLAISAKRGERTIRYSVTVGDEVDPDAIEADLDKGVLTLKAPKRPETKPKKIALKGVVDAKSLESGEKK